MSHDVTLMEHFREAEKRSDVRGTFVHRLQQIDEELDRLRRENDELRERAEKWERAFHTEYSQWLRLCDAAREAERYLTMALGLIVATNDQEPVIQEMTDELRKVMRPLREALAATEEPSDCPVCGAYGESQCATHTRYEMDDLPSLLWLSQQIGEARSDTRPDSLSREKVMALLRSDRSAVYLDAARIVREMAVQDMTEAVLLPVADALERKAKEVEQT